MRTRVTDILGIRYPILQGGMAWVSTAQLAAAVSRGGGLGIIGAGGMSANELREEIRRAKTLTTEPFGVNLMLLSPVIAEQIYVVKEERVPVVTTGAGNPSSLLKEFNQLGILTVPVVASVSLAKRLERSGADLVIAEGMESGGHIGEITTMCLIPQMVDALDIPVVAAGGIGDGRGMAASFALGAEGVQMGTRFICTMECMVHERYKQAIIKASDRSTTITGLSTGHPVRSLRNRLSRRFTELEERRACREEMEALGEGCLRRAACEGEIEDGSVMAGQIAGLIHDCMPVGQIIERLIEETKKALFHLERIVSE
ncbi:MAG TPA: nitronate monooxygenase [Atribacteraceae bacterium]|nr:nitronate monooxygenase [Atribacteraceae bacterium]